MLLHWEQVRAAENESEVTGYKVSGVSAVIPFPASGQPAGSLPVGDLAASCTRTLSCRVNPFSKRALSRNV